MGCRSFCRGGYAHFLGVARIVAEAGLAVVRAPMTAPVCNAGIGLSVDRSLKCLESVDGHMGI